MLKMNIVFLFLINQGLLYSTKTFCVHNFIHEDLNNSQFIYKDLNISKEGIVFWMSNFIFVLFKEEKEYNNVIMGILQNTIVSKIVLVQSRALASLSFLQQLYLFRFNLQAFFIYNFHFVWYMRRKQAKALN